jgi:hypothetical protein
MSLEALMSADGDDVTVFGDILGGGTYPTQDRIWRYLPRRSDVLIVWIYHGGEPTKMMENYLLYKMCLNFSASPASSLSTLPSSVRSSCRNTARSRFSRS